MSQVTNKISDLKLQDNIITTLRRNKINSLKQLCSKTRSELRKLNLKQFEVKQIEIQVQLLGLDLKNTR